MTRTRIGARKRRQAEAGSSMVEFALSSVVLLMTMLGMMEIALALYSNHMIYEAAREGSRYAMVRGDTCVASGASCTATAAEIQSYVQGLEYPGISASNMTVTTTYAAYPAGNTCSPNANCANPGDQVTVTVSYTFPLSIPFAPASVLHMGSSSSMVISQ